MAKSDKTRLPKTLAGIKVPKALRKPGVLDGLVSSSVGRRLLADALIAAASAAAASLVAAQAGEEKDGREKGKAAGAAQPLGDAAKAAAGAIASVMTEAAQSLLPGAEERNGSADGDGAAAKPRRTGARNGPARQSPGAAKRAEKTEEAASR